MIFKVKEVEFYLRIMTNLSFLPYKLHLFTAFMVFSQLSLSDDDLTYLQFMDLLNEIHKQSDVSSLMQYFTEDKVKDFEEGFIILKNKINNENDVNEVYKNLVIFGLDYIDISDHKEKALADGIRCLVVRGVHYNDIFYSTAILYKKENLIYKIDALFVEADHTSNPKLLANTKLCDELDA